jgi:hypothetical protein
LQQWLLDYENDHPEDVTGDTCILCGGSEEAATDWISCDSCGSWVRIHAAASRHRASACRTPLRHWHETWLRFVLQVHFSCDDRAKAGELGTFREYAMGETARTYVCPECDGAKRQRTG